jgi:hypothetical protein
MPDKVRGKKLGDFGYWIEIDSSDLGSGALIVAWKQPESEMKKLAGRFSAKDVAAAAEYQKAIEGNLWGTVIITPEYGKLPVEIWRQKAASGITIVSGSEVPPDNMSAPTFVSPTTFRYCLSCHNVFQGMSATICPLCGKPV